MKKAVAASLLGTILLIGSPAGASGNSVYSGDGIEWRSVQVDDWSGGQESDWVEVQKKGPKKQPRTFPEFIVWLLIEIFGGSGEENTDPPPSPPQPDLENDTADNACKNYWSYDESGDGWNEEGWSPLTSVEDQEMTKYCEPFIDVDLP